MKKIFIALTVLFLSSISYAQTCEEREDKLLSSMGSFSAAVLYNSYGMIGAIADGYNNNAYDAKAVNDLMVTQQKLYDNLAQVLEELKSGNVLKDESDKKYAASAIEILKGLKRQAKLMNDYAETRNQKNQELFEAQRKKNWKDIATLMGIEE
jgi:hypothetical protein